jgi:hypothetical protein
VGLALSKFFHDLEIHASVYFGDRNGRQISTALPTIWLGPNIHIGNARLFSSVCLVPISSSLPYSFVVHSTPLGHKGQSSYDIILSRLRCTDIHGVSEIASSPLFKLLIVNILTFVLF